MSEAPDLRRRFQARIAGRLAELHGAKALVGPLPLTRVGVPPSLDERFRRLVRVCISLGRARQLVDSVIPAALKEPGRLFARQVEHYSGSPRGAIDWPKTVALRRGRERQAELEFICRSSHRHLLAPENILLVLCVDEVTRSSTSGGAALEVQGFWGRDGKSAVARLQKEAHALLNSPAFRECRQAARDVSSSGEIAILRLEGAVAARVGGRPSAAPDWAKSLLSIRRDLRWLPRRVQEPDLPISSLWLLLAHLEMLSALRAILPVRQMSEQPNCFSCGAQRLTPATGTPDWVLLKADRAVAGVSIQTLQGRDSVRLAAFERLFCYEFENQVVNRWLVLHGCADAIPAIHRNGLEVRFIEMPSAETPGAGLRQAFADWVRPPP